VDEDSSPTLEEVVLVTAHHHHQSLKRFFVLAAKKGKHGEISVFEKLTPTPPSLPKFQGEMLRVDERQGKP
jgi:hypothetical protein